MSDYDIFRVKCADGSVFEPVDASMSGQGVVRVWRDGATVVVLPPSAACTIERVLPYPAPPAPDLTINLIAVVVFLALGALLGLAMYRAGFPCVLYGFAPMPPMPPIPPMPPKPPESH